MSLPQILQIADIEIGEQRRPVDLDRVDALALDIAVSEGHGIGHGGLRIPIDVQHYDDRFILISGLHRLRAIQKLGRDEIAAVAHVVDDDEAAMMEITENFLRHDLNPLERALIVRDFREAFEARFGQVTVGKPKKNSVIVTEYSEAVRARLGLGEETAKRSFRIAKCLAPDVVERLRPTLWAENQAALLELSGVSNLEHQRRAVDRLLDPDHPAETMREAIGSNTPVTGLPDDEAWFRKSLSLFEVKKTWRRRFFREAFGRDLDTIRSAGKAAGFAVIPIGPATQDLIDRAMADE